MTMRQVVIAAVILGAVAGYVVWWLRRFEVEDMHHRFSEYLGKYDEFRKWEAQNGGD